MFDQLLRARSGTCSPDAMSFIKYVPAAISLSPKISANRAPILLAVSSARFSLRSTDRSTDIPARAQFRRQRSRMHFRRIPQRR